MGIFSHEALAIPESDRWHSPSPMVDVKATARLFWAEDVFEQVGILTDCVSTGLLMEEELMAMVSA